tara:strand:+ start:1097 stop:1297 length:201 start_codon:yes stop_codon:yes gene_type:complete
MSILACGGGDSTKTDSDGQAEVSDSPSADYSNMEQEASLISELTQTFSYQRKIRALSKLKPLLREV